MLFFCSKDADGNIEITQRESRYFYMTESGLLSYKSSSTGNSVYLTYLTAIDAKAAEAKFVAMIEAKEAQAD